MPNKLERPEVSKSTFIAETDSVFSEPVKCADAEQRSLTEQGSGNTLVHNPADTEGLLSEGKGLLFVHSELVSKHHQSEV